eukprot:TCONS_00018400-protein
MSSIFSPTNISKKKQKLKQMEAEATKLRQNRIYTFDMLFKDWSANEQFLIDYPDITTVLELAAIIPPSTAKVERSFSLMNLILTPQRKRLLPEYLSHCMRICKFRKLTDADFDEILKRWLVGEGTETAMRRVACRL